jgi:hypothetical protein
MERAEFILIGTGWRSQFFLRAAREMPQRFGVQGILTRDAAKGAKLEADWGVPTYRTLEELVRGSKPLFAVVSVEKGVAPAVVGELAGRRIPVLCETPPAPDLESLDRVNEWTDRGGRIQVAEQYIFQPMHAARLGVIQSGLLGNISQAQVSFTQGYHGISLIRHYLGIGFDSVKITARHFDSPIYKGPDRAGPPTEEKIIPCRQTMAWLEFGNRLGVFDFAGDQHRSYIRSDRMLMRGERGEINQDRVRYLQDFRTPIEYELHRLDAGVDENLEGYFHKGILGGGKWWYENPFGSARLFDDEIAVATCLAKMAEYARGGKDFYSLAEASHDQYLALKMEEAATAGKTMEIHARGWAK